MNEKIKIVARRSDGFGQRLYALLNAMYLSDKLDLKFGFTWSERFIEDEFHAISKAEDFFNKEFLDNHLMREDEVLDYKNIVGTDLCKNDILEPINKGTLVGWAASNSHLRNTFREDLLPDSSLSLWDVFCKIGFSERIQAAIHYAQELTLPDDLIAVHIRHGDVVFGDYRNYGLYVKKVIPISVAKLLLKKFSAEGRNVILFCSDPALSQNIMASFLTFKNVLKVEDFHSDAFSARDEKAIIDMVMMSRCKDIVAGASGFAIQASLINGISLIDPLKILDRSEIALFTDKDIEENTHIYHPFSKAISFWYLWSFTKKTVPFETSQNWLDIAQQNDPSNLLYPIKRAVALISNRKFSDASNELRKIIEADVHLCSLKQSPLFKQLSFRVGTGFVLKADFKHIKLLASRGCPYALYVYGIIMFLQKSYSEAEDYGKLALLIKPVNFYFTELVKTCMLDRLDLKG